MVDSPLGESATNARRYEERGVSRLSWRVLKACACTRGIARGSQVQSGKPRLSREHHGQVRAGRHATDGNGFAVVHARQTYALTERLTSVAFVSGSGTRTAPATASEQGAPAHSSS